MLVIKLIDDVAKIFNANFLILFVQYRRGRQTGIQPQQWQNQGDSSQTHAQLPH